MYVADHLVLRQKAFGGDLDDYIEGNDGRDILVGDMALYETWPNSRLPKRISTIDCDVGGSDDLYGGEGDVDYIVGGSSNDTIFADDSTYTDNSTLGIVFGDHAEIMFYENHSHRLDQAIAINADCESGGSDIIILGPGDDWVS